MKSPYVESGRLRHRVAIRRRDVSARDPWHDRTVAVAKGVERWASIRQASVRETEQAAQMKLDVSHVLELHAESGLADAGDYIDFGSRLFEIVQLQDVEERGAVLRVLVTERVAGVG